MADERKTPDPLNELAQTIRRQVIEKLRQSGIGAEISLTLDDPADTPTDTDSSSGSMPGGLPGNTSGGRIIPEKSAAPKEQSDDFWDMGKPKPRVYEKPSFEGRTIGLTDITEETAPAKRKALAEKAENAVARAESAIARAETIAAQAETVAAQAETVVPKEEFERTHPASRSGSMGRPINTVDGPRIVTNSYRRRTPPRHPSAPSPSAVQKKASAVLKSYQPGGPLIRQIDVRTWDSEVVFYGRFQSDAQQSHRAQPAVPHTEKMEAVPYFSYVPQYAHMTGKQVDYYRWVRENIRRGKYPDCDLPYLQLYIFEILNLPEEIPPEEGAALLASLWLGYRARYPRLDGYLCEWLPDYCMIHGQKLPSMLRELLPTLVPKAQFKEFYLDLDPDDEENRLILSRCLIETLSDYDFRSSRYYPEHKDEFEAKIPEAVAFAVRQAMAEKRGLFSLDRVYKMTRDSYCGAIVTSDVKRRLDLEFCSFTRRADSRIPMTALVKYAENKVRALVGVKAKLGSAGLDPADAATLDRWFEPMTPQKEKRSAEDRYMPEDYLKYYEAETSGFDPAAAAAIEKESWVNTSRLTGEEYGEESVSAAEYEPDETAVLEGELTDLPAIPANSPAAVPEEIAEQSEVAETAVSADEAPSAQPGNEVAEALKAALTGSFREYARANGFYEGELADRVNTVFLDVLGDVVLEDGGSGFALIEDYREDVKEWLSAQ